MPDPTLSEIMERYRAAGIPWREGGEDQVAVCLDDIANLETVVVRQASEIERLDDAIRDALDFLPEPGGPRNDPKKAAQILSAALNEKEPHADA